MGFSRASNSGSTQHSPRAASRVSVAAAVFFLAFAATLGPRDCCGFNTTAGRPADAHMGLCDCYLNSAASWFHVLDTRPLGRSKHCLTSSTCIPWVWSSFGNGSRCLSTCNPCCHPCHLHCHRVTAKPHIIPNSSSCISCPSGPGFVQPWV